jgi:hypothetical protein
MVATQQGVVAGTNDKFVARVAAAALEYSSLHGCQYIAFKGTCTGGC